MFAKVALAVAAAVALGVGSGAGYAMASSDQHKSTTCQAEINVTEDGTWGARRLIVDGEVVGSWSPKVQYPPAFNGKPCKMVVLNH